MKKSLIALAALAATGAFAQSSVTLSGRASMEFGAWEAKGAASGAAADFKSRNRVADTASRITFAVTEDLGGGLRAGVLCETGINIDSGSNTGQAGTLNANTSEWCSREGRASIGNNTAELRLGRQNVWWTQGALNTLGSTYLGTDAGTNLINGGVGVYTVRGENQIKVVGGRALGAFANSEVYMGLMGNSGGQSLAVASQTLTVTNGAVTVPAVAYPTPNTTGEAAAAGANASGKYHGFKLNYSQGAWVAMIDAQNSNLGTQATATNTQKREAIKYGVGYRFAGANSASIVTLQIWDKESKTTAGVKSEDGGYMVVAQYDLGGGLIAHAQYAKANNRKDAGVTVANTGATAYTLGVTKALSKRTHLYGAMHNITNKSAASYAMSGGNYQSGTPAAGADTKAWGLGMVHNF